MSSERTRISVIICTWNRAESLRATLRSLSTVEIPDHVDCEVVVVDNNSVDHTRRVVEECASLRPAISLRYCFEPRQGKQFALNHGIENAGGALLAFTDDDVHFDRGWIRAIVASFEDGCVDVAGGVTMPITSRPLPDWYGPEMSAVLAGVDLGPAILDCPPDDYVPAGTNLIVARRVIDAAGGFSERHYRHMDYEFGTRVRRLGFRVRYDPRLIVTTSVPSSILTRQYFRRWYFKQGIAASFDQPLHGSQVALVPRWMWRQLVEEAVGRVADTLRGDRRAAFAHEMRVAHLLGYMLSRWNLKLRPDAHDRWAARWSQKSNEQFV